jgi:hypothetical protein
MGARRCRGTGRGESPDAKEEMAAGTPGGDPGGGGGVLLAESRDSRARRWRGSAAHCLEAGPASTGKLGLLGQTKTPRTRLLKAHDGLRMEKFCVGCRPRESTGILCGDLGFQTRPESEASQDFSSSGC